MHIPCFQWLPEDKTNVQTSLPQAKNNFQVELVLPITQEELLEYYGHQLGMLIIGLLPVLDFYLGLGSASGACRFGTFLYAGLYLNGLVGRILYLPQTLLNNAYEMTLAGIHSQEDQMFFHKHGLSTDSQVDTRMPPGFQATSLYIRTADDPGEMFSEADQMIAYASILLKPGAGYLETQFSHDNRATMTPVYRSGENNVFQLSVTNPDNITHSYDIAHNNGCNWLLSRDGVPVSDYMAVSWYQGKGAGVSLSPVNHPQSVKRNKLTIRLPRELLNLGLSRAHNALQQFSGGLQSQIPALVSRIVVAFGGVGEKDRYVLVPKDHFASPYTRPPVRQPDQWLLPMQASREVGTAQLMQNPPQDQKMTLGSSSSGNSAGGSSSGKGQGKKADSTDGGENEDDDEERKSSPSSTGSLSSSGNDMSLIELVSSHKLASLSAASISQLPRRLVNTNFIKLLSTAGLAQVIVGEDLDDIDRPLAISTTLVRYLCDTLQSSQPPWLETLKRKLETNSYYVELDHELYDVMLEQIETIRGLATARAQAFVDFRANLKQYINARNTVNPGHRFIYIGGEAVRAQIGFLKGGSHFLRGNFPITNDIDVLMRQGSIQEFITYFPGSMSGYTVSVSETSSMAFPFPHLGGECLLGMHKVKLISPWGDYLPNLDISFPFSASDADAPHFGDNQSILFESLNRALKYQGKQQKYLDRVLLLRGLLPGSVGAEFLYFREFVYPALQKEKEQLVYAVAQHEVQQKALEVKIQEQEKERGELSGQLQRHQGRELELDNLIALKIQQIEKAREEAEALYSRLEELQKELDASRQWQKNLGQFKAQQALLQQQAEALKADNNNKHVKIARLKEKLQTRKKKVEQQNTEIESLKAHIGQQKSEAESLSEQVEALKSEKETYNESLELVRRQLKESNDRSGLLDKELVQTRKRLEELNKQEQVYQEKEKKINQELTRATEQREEARQQHERLREEARWYRNDRNWRVAIGMIPVALVGMREFLVPRFHDAAKATCSRFRRTLTYQYCVRNWVNEDNLLRAMTVLDQLPDHTRIFRFSKSQQFKPGYFLSGQDRASDGGLTNFLVQTEKMHLHIPGDFMALDNLYISELRQILSALSRQLTSQDSSGFVEQFTVANLLLCGIMPGSNRQNKCAEALAGTFRESRQWPCNMDSTDSSKANACESFMLPGFTRKLTDRFVLALIPVWFVGTTGKLRWYDPLPVMINRHTIRKLSGGGTCIQFLSFSRYCDGKAVKVWQFTNNHWDLASYPCDTSVLVEVGTPKAFWLQSWSGKVNNVISCRGQDLVETVW